MTIAEMIVKIGADIKEYQEKIKQVKKQNENLRETLNKVGTGSMVAGGALLGGIGFAVKAAAEEEEAQMGLKTALENTNQYTEEQFQRMVGLANQLQETTKFGDEAIQQMMTLGLSMGMSAEQVEQITPLILDLSTTMGVDLQTAMRASAMALEGQTGMLRRYGVDVQKAEDGTVSLGSVTQALSRYQGQAQKQGETFLGQIEILKNAFTDMMKPIGQTVIPYITQMMNAIKKVIGAFNNLPEPVKKVIGPLTTFSGVGLLVAGAFLKLLSPILSLVSVLPQIASGFIAIQMAGGPILWIIEGIALAVLLLYVAWKNNWGGIQDKTKAVIEAVKDFLQKFWDSIKKFVGWVKNVFQAIVKAFQGDFSQIKELGSQLLDAFWRGVKAVWSLFLGWLSGLIRDISGTVSGWYRSMYNWGSNLVNRFWSGMKGVWVRLKNWVKEWGKAFSSIIFKWYNSFKKWGKNLINSFVEGIKSAWESLKGGLGKIGEIIADLFKPGSPTKAGPLSKDGGMEGWGYKLMQNFAQGLRRGQGEVETVLNKFNPIIKGGYSISGVGTSEATEKLKEYTFEILSFLRTQQEIWFDFFKSWRFEILSFLRTQQGIWFDFFKSWQKIWFDFFKSWRKVWYGLILREILLLERIIITIEKAASSLAGVLAGLVNSLIPLALMWDNFSTDFSTPIPPPEENVIPPPQPPTPPIEPMSVNINVSVPSSDAGVIATLVANALRGL